MPSTDPRVDAYIAKSGEFAQPVLRHLRRLVHQACPAITENMKWCMPAFEHQGIVCGMAAFKAHCAITFPKQSLLESDAFAPEKTAMGSFGRITAKADLPGDDVLLDRIRRAAELNEQGVKVPKKPAGRGDGLVVPKELTAALARNRKARATWDGFPQSCRKEYIRWITEAKTVPTRERRVATTIEWLAEGKRRNWKYEKC